MRIVTLLLCVVAGACQGATPGRVAPEPASHGRVPEQATPPRDSASQRAHAPPADTTPPIRTDRTLYVLRRDSASGELVRASARITYTNRRSSPVYLDGCPNGRPNLAVGTVGPPMRYADLHPLCAQTARTPYISVRPGETRSWPITLRTIDRSMAGKGPFRVLISVYTRPAPGLAGPLPIHEGWSNLFWVRVED
jgi:hypothetical protein